MDTIRFKLRLTTLFAMLLFTLSCSDPAPRTCRISSFLWEGQFYNLEYTGNRLTRLVSPDARFDLHYNEYGQLYAGEHYLPGHGGVPSYTYTYNHGPFGINKIDMYTGAEHQRFLFNYTSTGEVDYIVNQYFYMGDVSHELTDHLYYNTEGNVTLVDMTSSLITSRYTFSQYDGNINPFMQLAEMVGNPKFFPLGLFSNFPMDFPHVSMGYRFSQNNPHAAVYELPSVDPAIQEFIHTYAWPYTTSITWNNDNYGVTSEYYEFYYDCGI
ncbi:hypothetical protein E1176_12810 [Fulvivirga sp. RKSG066]|uniref:hypothetical protein n=1 Tax=Fulvivirga aurantia TaxID=2529383 RepID=UPI0012BBD8DB|nr:hypothetical protein [Fulvivirga aurantia]MTI21906.1 hypothetical protein [Fulvivirga aurantia]